MAKLIGYRERIPMNLYDAFQPRDLAQSQCGKLFSSVQNIGNWLHTNMQVPGALAADHTASVLNWYARTNLAITPEFEASWNAWTHATIVTLVLGNMSIHSLPLSDLLGRKEGDGERRYERFDSSSTGMTSLARRLHHQWNFSDPNSREGDAQWATYSDVERGRWNIQAMQAIDTLSAPLLAIIPKRQTFRVNITTDPRALGAMLEMMPTNTAPESLVWVHLEGMLTRDITL